MKRCIDEVILFSGRRELGTRKVQGRSESDCWLNLCQSGNVSGKCQAINQGSRPVFPVRKGCRRF